MCLSHPSFRKPVWASFPLTVWQDSFVFTARFFTQYTENQPDYIPHFIISFNTEWRSGSITLDSWLLSMNTISVLTFEFYFNSLFRVPTFPSAYLAVFHHVEFTALFPHLYVVLVWGDDQYPNLWSILLSSLFHISIKSKSSAHQWFVQLLNGTSVSTSKRSCSPTS